MTPEQAKILESALTPDQRKLLDNIVEIIKIVIEGTRARCADIVEEGEFIPDDLPQKTQLIVAEALKEAALAIRNSKP